MFEQTAIKILLVDGDKNLLRMARARHGRFTLMRQRLALSEWQNKERFGFGNRLPSAL